MQTIQWFFQKINLPSLEEIKNGIIELGKKVVSAVNWLLYGTQEKDGNGSAKGNEGSKSHLSPVIQQPTSLPEEFKGIEIKNQIEELEIREALSQLARDGKELEEIQAEEEHNRNLLCKYRTNRRIIEEKLSGYGSLETPISLLTEFEEVKKSIKSVEQRIDTITERRALLMENINRAKQKAKRFSK